MIHDGPAAPCYDVCVPGERIRELDQLAAMAWPSAVRELVDGWWLRFNWGVTRRANSVLPLEAGAALPLDRKLESVEAFYAERDHPARFYISPAAAPDGLDQALAERGYLRYAGAQVQTAAVSTVVERAAGAPNGQLTITSGFERLWFEAYCRIEAIEPAVRYAPHALMQRIGAGAGFARLMIDGQPAAIGLGVVQGVWCGLFCIATDADYRRRGAATALLGGLARWAAGNGASHLYLQVAPRNEPAQNLYARLGFEALYSYHYREAPRR
jgi:ribosomal protein S18 acetylase RimI-like enzyme